MPIPEPVCYQRKLTYVFCFLRGKHVLLSTKKSWAVHFLYEGKWLGQVVRILKTLHWKQQTSIRFHNEDLAKLVVGRSHWKRTFRAHSPELESNVYNIKCHFLLYTWSPAPDNFTCAVVVPATCSSNQMLKNKQKDWESGEWKRMWIKNSRKQGKRNRNYDLGMKWTENQRAGDFRRSETVRFTVKSGTWPCEWLQTKTVVFRHVLFNRTCGKPGICRKTQ